MFSLLLSHFQQFEYFTTGNFISARTFGVQINLTVKKIRESFAS
jgi:hypothetical protein